MHICGMYRSLPVSTVTIKPGLSRLQHLLPLYQNRGIGEVSLKKISCKMGRCTETVDWKTGIILPATETHVREAVEAIKSEKVIAVPTDTLYGFACDACSVEAVDRIYEIKGRQQTSPLAICVGDVSDITHYAVSDHLPDGLLDNLLPGPVTIVLKRGGSRLIETSLNPGLDSIGIRVPDSNFIRSITRGSKRALALTSANLSGQPSSVCISDFENLWQHCSFVFDGGLLPSGPAGSTIVDLTIPGRYKILRPGSAMQETIKTMARFNLKVPEDH